MDGVGLRCRENDHWWPIKNNLITYSPMKIAVEYALTELTTRVHNPYCGICVWKVVAKSFIESKYSRSNSGKHCLDDRWPYCLRYRYSRWAGNDNIFYRLNVRRSLFLPVTIRLQRFCDFFSYTRPRARCAMLWYFREFRSITSHFCVKLCSVELQLPNESWSPPARRHVPPVSRRLRVSRCVKIRYT